MRRPTREEYPEYYAKYVERPEECEVIASLAESGLSTAAFFTELGEERSRMRYAPGKWSLKELLGHVMDTERIFSYRALALSRGDQTPLPGFDQDPYIENAGFHERALSDLLDEYRAIRAATVSLFASFTPEQGERTGTISGFPFVTCTIPWLLLGHELHHMDVVRERYLAPNA